MNAPAISQGLIVSLWNPKAPADSRGRRWRPAGFLTTQGPSAGLFTYFSDYDGPALDPVNMNYRQHLPGAVFRPHGGTGDIPGAFHDALPGHFGMQVLWRHFPELSRATPAALIDWFGQRAHSGLLFERAGRATPERYISNLKDLDAVRGPAVALAGGATPATGHTADNANKKPVDGIRYLEVVREQAIRSQMQEMTRMLTLDGSRALSPVDEERLYSTTSAGGAQPKAFLKFEGKYWIAKFNRPGDPVNAVRVEHAMLELARASGIDAPFSRVVTLPDSGVDVLLIERYDRSATHRAHRVSALTLLGLPHSGAMASADYQDLLALAKNLGGEDGQADRHEMLRRAIFQSGASITDNHLRNFEWMVGPEGRWVPTPLFDLAPNPQSELATPLCGLRTQRQILTADLPAILARKTGLPLPEVSGICADVAGRMVTNLETVIVRARMGVAEAQTMHKCLPVAHLAALAAQWQKPAAQPKASASPRP